MNNPTRKYLLAFTSALALAAATLIGGSAFANSSHDTNAPVLNKIFPVPGTVTPDTDDSTESIQDSDHSANSTDSDEDFVSTSTEVTEDSEDSDSIEIDNSDETSTPNVSVDFDSEDSGESDD